MGCIKAGVFISLDGVVEAPETWHLRYFNDEMGAVVGGLMSSQDAMLLGRTTYEAFAAYWPGADPDDPFTKQMNSTPKYVVSTTLERAGWERTTVIGGDVYERLRELKAQQNLGITGSATLVSSLLRERLIDELHLLVHPVVVGSGKRLFSEGTSVPLTLIESRSLSTGVVHMTYGPEAVA
jgi:dihydrofolate reductase